MSEVKKIATREAWGNTFECRGAYDIENLFDGYWNDEEE